MMLPQTVITVCSCTGPDDAAPIVRGPDGLHCLECGADQAALVDYHDTIAAIRSLPLRELVAEIERRTDATRGREETLQRTLADGC